VGDIYEVASVQSTDSNSVIIRGKNISNDQKNQVLETLTNNLGEVTEQRFETVGPVLGEELLEKTIMAIIIVSTLITLYVAKQFSEFKYGISAILAMFHDSLILLGIFSILGHFWGVEVDVLFVTALLTVLGYSVNDTIVVFDRVRENLIYRPKETFVETINHSVNETVRRSINTSLTTLLVLLSLYFLGGETIKDFVLVLVLGTIFGTYSSIFVASPLLVVWQKLSKKK